MKRAHVHIAPFEYIPGDERLTVLPIARLSIDGYVNDARDSIWPASEVAVEHDIFDYKMKLCPDMRQMVNTILAFFATSDGVININLAQRFSQEVRMQDATYFYNIQIMMEDVHAHVYSILLDAIIEDADRREELIRAASTMPVIANIIKYMNDCINSEAPFAERLLRMACIEGITFQGCFCMIYWLTKYGYMPGLGQSNELISRDENLHATFALFLYILLPAEHRCSRETIEKIFNEAIELSAGLNTEALPRGLPGMNSTMATNYAKSRADELLELIDQEPIYRVKSDFTFMDQLNMINRGNFFERKVTEYSKKAVIVDGGGISNDF